MPMRRVRGRNLDFALVLGGILVNVAVALSARHFPYQDIVNHLTRYVLMDRFWFGQPPVGISVKLLPTPYIGLDLIGVALVHLLGPEPTLRILGILPLVVLPLGMDALLRATAPAQRGWALVGCLFGFSCHYLAGFLNFALGIGLALWWLAFWWPRRASSSRIHRLGLALGGAGLYLVHLSAPLIVLGVWSLDLVCQLATHRREVTGRKDLGRRLWLGASVAGAVGVLWLWAAAASPATPGPGLITQFRPLREKLLMAAYPFLSFSRLQAAVMLTGYLGAVMALFLHNRGARLRNAFLTAGPVFFLLFVVSPATMDVDVRWLLPAMLLPFCAPAPGPAPGRMLLALLLVSSLAHAATIAVFAHRTNERLDRFDAVLAALPARRRLLPLVTDRNRPAAMSPYLHYSLWYTIRKKGQVASLFTRTGEYEGASPWYHLNHFRSEPTPYFPSYAWGVTLFTPLNCGRIQREYDFILQAGKNGRAAQLIGKCAVEALRLGDVTLYRVLR